MIDLTPLDVRNKRGDFRRILRGYEPQEVDTFLELVAERLEQIVRENLMLKERAQILQSQVESQSGREQAVQEALVTAQTLRADMREQARREAEHLLKEAEIEARRLVTEAEAEIRTRIRNSERNIDQAMTSLEELERRRQRFLNSFRQLLQREMDNVEVEEKRTPLEERPFDLELGRRGGEETPVADQVSAGGAAVATGAVGGAAPQAEVRSFVTEAPPSEVRPAQVDMSVDGIPVEDLAPEIESAEANPGQGPDTAQSTDAEGRIDEEVAVEPPAGRGREELHDDLLLYLDGDDSDAKAG